MSGAPPPRPMSSLKAASLCEGMCSCLLLSFLPLHVRALGEESFLVVSCLLALPALILFGVNNFWGAFVDATGGFRVAERLGLLGYAFCLVALAAVRSSVAAVAAVAGFSLLYGALRPTLLSHATLLEEKAKARAISGILLFQSLGWLVSGVIYGLFYTTKDPGAEWTTDMILGIPALAGLLMALLLPRWIADPDIGAPPGSFAAVMKQGFFKVLLGDLGRVYRAPELFRLCIVVFLTSMSNWAFFGMFSLIFTEEMHGTPLGLGLTLSASTALAVIVFSFVGRFVDRFGGRVGLFGSILLYIVVYTTISLLRDPWIVFVIFIIPVYPIFLVSASALAAEATGSRQRAGGLGVMAGVFALSMVAGSLMGGLIGDLFGLRTIIVGSACLSTVCLAAFFLFVGFRGRAGLEREGYGVGACPGRSCSEPAAARSPRAHAGRQGPGAGPGEGAGRTPERSPARTAGREEP